jgi:hypothetical protein
MKPLERTLLVVVLAFLIMVLCACSCAPVRKSPGARSAAIITLCGKVAAVVITSTNGDITIDQQGLVPPEAFDAGLFLAYVLYNGHPRFVEMLPRCTST